MANFRLFAFSLWWFVCLTWGALLQAGSVKADAPCDPEISETLRILLNPQEGDSMQVQALRRQLLRRLQEDLDLAELEDERNYKRNLAALAAWNDLPDKRNLEALARAGQWYKNPPELDNSEDSNYKRSIANLAKNGQPPLMPLPLENQKRGIEALARNGDLHRRQNYQEYRTLLEALYDKRNPDGTGRKYNFPVGSTAGFGKRTIGSLARNGELPYAAYGKRNIQSLARDGALGKRSNDYVDELVQDKDKRNIQSIKARQRNKRHADYFDNEVVYPMPADYEDLLQDLVAQQEYYPVEDKRFLGSVAKTGWFRPSPRSSSAFTALPDKRHVAALARLGWLPSYRSVRRFNRSGRSFIKPNNDDNTCREDSTNGKTQTYSYTKISSVPLDSKRYLLQPAVDNILLKKVLRPPRMTLI